MSTPARCALAALEHRVEGGGQLPAAIADQETHPLQPLAYRHCQVAGLPRGPGAVRVRSDAGNMDPPGTCVAVAATAPSRPAAGGLST
jgi:hypothetical protein